MTFKLIKQISLFVLLGLMVFTSCTKEDSVTIEEKEEPIEVGFRMSVNGAQIQTDAVAAYCKTDSVEFIMIANKSENLSFPLETQNFEADDFVYFKSITDNSTWGYGGQALDSTVTGLPFQLAIMFSDAVITIDSNDGENILGSSEGVLYGTDGLGNFVEFPYEMDFLAEIVAQSDYCD